MASPPPPVPLPKKSSFTKSFLSHLLIPLTQLKRKKAPAAAPAAAPTAPPTSEPAPANPAPGDTAQPAPTSVEGAAPPKPPFTTAEDIVLLQLKTQDKTWKEIGDVLTGRDKDELRNRYKEIHPQTAPTAQESAAPATATADPDPKPAAETNTKKQKGGGKQQQQKKKWNPQTKQLELVEPATAAAATPPPPPPPVNGVAPAATTSAPPTSVNNNNEALVASAADLKIRGILKRGVDGGLSLSPAAIPPGATSLNGSPIIYLDETDDLSIDEISLLYNMNCAFEEQRWVRMASKFFDQTGKRVEPGWIREKLGNCR
ncbi:MAG: hypothetical protein Q9220_006195 [cf. Caloplaca sp. 1 TL-2023]